MTEMVEKMPPQVLEQIVSSIPMKRLVQTSEVARAALFLSDEEVSFITGDYIN